MGTAFARQVARRLSADAGAIPPIDLTEMLSWQGLALSQEDGWPKELCARYYPNEQRICVNRTHRHVRQRFSVAHELGHFALGHDQIDIDHTVATIYGSEDETFEVEGDFEIDANAFATELLMPREWIKRQAGTLGAWELARLIQEGCDVSASAAWYRVSELKLGGFASAPRQRR